MTATGSRYLLVANIRMIPFILMMMLPTLAVIRMIRTALMTPICLMALLLGTAVTILPPVIISVCLPCVIPIHILVIIVDMTRDWPLGTAGQGYSMIV